jgi:hypothetical protein
MSFARIIPLVFLLLVFSISVPFSINMFAESESGTNMTGSQYEEQYNSTVGISKVYLSEMKFVGLIIALAIIVVIIALAVKIAKRY